MRFGTFRHVLLMGLLATCCQAAMADDKTPTATPVPKPVSVKSDCADAKSATKKECEKVAAKIDAQAADPQAHPTNDQAQSSADYVHHSSPAMRTPKEVAQDKAKAKSDEAKAKSQQKPDGEKPASK